MGAAALRTPACDPARQPDRLGLEPAPGGKAMWSHDGSNGRWFGIVAVLPDERRAVMVVANAAGAEVERAVNRLVVKTLGLS